ncbi:MAG: hypothetical protein JWQ63_2315 [Mucilaginibacter sp.]|nr:hypothetical protein [Mucilaginibacter sp.]
MSASNLELLHHIQDEVDFVLLATNNKTKDEVINDAVLSRAVIRSLEIIGEASKKLDEEFKTAHSGVEWSKMARTRDRLIHDYFGVNYDIIWDIIQNKLPDLQYYVAYIFKETGK